ncbi:MAG: histidinol-phosphatase HisJ family protein [Erysipelotrichaceae bacterium]|nr:histidinol-phosphatase HisJ family protein [Erysipelotrichaceae bacterium]
MKKDLHTHTVLSDGENSAEEMIEAAIAKGLDVIGISDHSFTSFDTSYCMKLEDYGPYVRQIGSLKKKYEGKIQVLCGLECDCYSDKIPEGLDYIIGSVHYVKADGKYLVIDWNEEVFRKIIEDHFHNDPYALCEAYYETLSSVYGKTHCDIVGHFDLITKFNEGDRFFDEHADRYVSAWKKAMEKLVKDVKCFEINHGAVNKGLRSVPYLNEEMRSYLLSLGGYYIDSSDAHTTANVGRFE